MEDTSFRLPYSAIFLRRIIFVDFADLLWSAKIKLTKFLLVNAYSDLGTRHFPVIDWVQSCFHVYVYIGRPEIDREKIQDLYGFATLVEDKRALTRCYHGQSLQC